MKEFIDSCLKCGERFTNGDCRYALCPDCRIDEAKVNGYTDLQDENEKLRLLLKSSRYEMSIIASYKDDEESPFGLRLIAKRMFTLCEEINKFLEV